MKEYHKNNLKTKYSHLDIKSVRRIGIEVFVTLKGHVVKLVNGAVDQVCRSVYAQETDLMRRKLIKGARRMKPLGQAGGGKATRILVRQARETGLPPFVKVANTLMARITGILAWYDAKVTNAMLEGINNKIEVMKKKGIWIQGSGILQTILMKVCYLMKYEQALEYIDCVLALHQCQEALYVKSRSLAKLERYQDADAVNVLMGDVFDMSTPDAKVLYMIAMLNELHIGDPGLNLMKHLIAVSPNTIKASLLFAN